MASVHYSEHKLLCSSSARVLPARMDKFCAISNQSYQFCLIESIKFFMVGADHGMDV